MNCVPKNRVQLSQRFPEGLQNRCDPLVRVLRPSHAQCAHVSVLYIYI